MATRSNIGMMLPDGNVKVAYCHYDGYPECVGEILLESYNTPERVSELLSFGDMSYLALEIHPSSDYHTFDNPEKGVTLFYGRDRGESDTDAKIYTMDEWHEHSQFIDFMYLFSGGKWLVKETGDGTGWDLLAAVLPDFADNLSEEDFKLSANLEIFK